MAQWQQQRLLCLWTAGASAAASRTSSSIVSMADPHHKQVLRGFICGPDLREAPRGPDRSTEGFTDSAKPDSPAGSASGMGLMSGRSHTSSHRCRDVTLLARRSQSCTPPDTRHRLGPDDPVHCSPEAAEGFLWLQSSDFMFLLSSMNHSVTVTLPMQKARQ